MFAPVVTLLVAPVIALPLLPLFRSAVWMGIVLFHGIPGMLLGGVAILFARRSSPATPGAGAV
jgi:hypothetical protein